jgi:hypothetical protein
MPPEDSRPEPDKQLQLLYRTVEARTTARAHTGGIRTAAEKALEALESYLQSPTKENLHAFAVAEREWASFAHRHPRICSEDLQAIVRAASRDWRPKKINTNHSTDYNPYCGFVYGMWSMQRPGLVKIGVTSRHPTDRQIELKKRTELPHLEILFFFEIGKPREVEHELHKRLGTYLRVKNQVDSREWFEMAQGYAMECVERTISHLQVRRFKTRYVCKALRQPTTPLTEAVGSPHFGGIRVRREEAK